DAGLQAAGRDVRLSGVHVRALLLDEKGPRLSRYKTFEEAGAAYLPRDQRGHRTRYPGTKLADDRGEAQSNDDRMGQLLLSGSGQPSLQCGGHSCAPKAASVALRQTQ